MGYIAKSMTADSEIFCYGKIKIEGGFRLINPVCGPRGKFEGIKPVYPLKGIIKQGVFLPIIKEALEGYEKESVIPDSALKNKKLPTLTEAIQAVHFPQTLLNINRYRERAELEELVKRISAYKLIRETEKRAKSYNAPASAAEKAVAALPFPLTPSQREAVDLIIGVLKSEKPLNAMLVGDVGSGKTAVAAIAAYFAAASGRQAALMAPTEILAGQHFQTFNKFFAPLGIKIALLTAGAPDKKEAARRAVSGEADIMIGTHAVISKKLVFKDLALVIVDEQHRFGVAQRTAITDKGTGADILTLSATPIPRSLRLAIFGDVDIINIERRHDPSNIAISVVSGEKREKMLSYIAEACKRGSQAYLVAPRIFDGEGIEENAAETLFKSLKNKLSGIKAGLLHGQMKAAEKDRILRDFSENKLSILVSTSVIEVGIDVPNANIMAVFSAEKFGLATLHQLRGRIGRSGQKAYFFLATDKGEEPRLRALIEERDGIKIAEKDYETRGAGDWLGEEQSGFSGFNPTVSLMRIAKTISSEIDAREHLEELKKYAERLKLGRVSLN
jgi:RecG-like helicase